MTIGALPMACTEIGTEFSTAVPFTLGNATLIALGGLSKPYSVSSWSGKTYGFIISGTAGVSGAKTGAVTGSFGSISNTEYHGSYFGDSQCGAFDNTDAGYLNGTGFYVVAENAGGVGIPAADLFTSISGYTVASAYTAALGTYRYWHWGTPYGFSNGVGFSLVVLPP